MIYRYEVPVDDEWHTVTGCGPVLYVACRRTPVVEFWAMPTPEPHVRSFRVYGTGHPIDVPTTHVGTAIAPGGSLVWHLMER